MNCDPPRAWLERGTRRSYSTNTLGAVARGAGGATDRETNETDTRQAPRSMHADAHASEATRQRGPPSAVRMHRSRTDRRRLSFCYSRKSVKVLCCVTPLPLMLLGVRCVCICLSICRPHHSHSAHRWIRCWKTTNLPHTSCGRS